LAQLFSSAFQKENNFHFCEIYGYKKRYDNEFFSPLSFIAVFESVIRDPGWVKIRIREIHPGSATLVAVFKFPQSLAGNVSAKMLLFASVTVYRGTLPQKCPGRNQIRVRIRHAPYRN
jgi:hypothetical protein